ncbi:MAG: hypothetical protein ACRYFS_10145 [Janthinobacterium lividum]
MDLPSGNVSASRRYVSAEQIEDVVRQLKDVVSVRAVLGPAGRVDELHVLVNPKRAPKQVARDIESAVRAHLDFSLDYKKISIAQIQGRAALAGSGMSGLPRLGFSDVSLAVTGSRAEATVRLRREDALYTGTAIGHASGYNQLRLIATAAIRAVEDRGSEDGTMVVEDLQADIPLAGRKAVVVLVSALAPPKGEELLTGSALIRQDPWKAVVNATLDAVNRRISLAFLEGEI